MWFFFYCLTDSVDSLETCVDVGVQRGKQHRTKDIISWVKKRRRHIRREDLIAFLCGKNPPNRHRTKHNHNRTLERSHSPRVNNGESIQQTSEPDLQAFREAISLQGKIFIHLYRYNNMIIMGRLTSFIRKKSLFFEQLVVHYNTGTLLILQFLMFLLFSQKKPRVE